MIKFASPCKLGSVKINMKFGVVEIESVKFYSFSVKHHLDINIDKYYL